MSEGERRRRGHHWRWGMKVKQKKGNFGSLKIEPGLFWSVPIYILYKCVVLSKLDSDSIWTAQKWPWAHSPKLLPPIVQQAPVSLQQPDSASLFISGPEEERRERIENEMEWALSVRLAYKKSIMVCLYQFGLSQMDPGVNGHRQRAISSDLIYTAEGWQPHARACESAHAIIDSKGAVNSKRVDWLSLDLKVQCGQFKGICCYKIVWKKNKKHTQVCVCMHLLIKDFHVLDSNWLHETQLPECGSALCGASYANALHTCATHFPDHQGLLMPASEMCYF